MTCKFCGNEIQDGAVFCPHCGAASGAPSAQWSSGGSAYAGPEAPVPRRKRGLLVGGAVALVAVIAAAAVAVSGVFSNPRKDLEKAVDKSLAAYARAEAAMGMSGLDQLVRDRAYSQRVSLTLNQITDQFTAYDLSALEGLGLRMDTGLNWADRALDFELAAFWDSEDIISLLLSARDRELHFASPQLTGGTFYGVNTETLGADLTGLGVEDVENVSFNLFDLIDAAVPAGQAEAMERQLREACKALWEASRVEKAGSETISVNQNQLKARAFQVIIPQAAVEDFGDALAQAITSVDYWSLYEQMLQAAGVSQEEIDEIMGQLGDADLYGQLSDQLRRAAAAVGEVRLMVYVSGGYVCAVRYDSRIQGSGVRMELQLGGGEEYVDNLRLEAEIDGQLVTVDSAGDHGGKSGVFTDNTVIRGPFPAVTSDFRYEPGGDGNNLSWSIDLAASGSLDMEGSLTAGGDWVDLRLDSMSFRLLGMDIFSLGLDYHLGPYQPPTEPNSSKLIGEMDGFELMGLMVNVQSSAQRWLNQTQQLFLDRLPPELLDELL